MHRVQNFGRQIANRARSRTRLAFLKGFDFGTVTIRAGFLGWRVHKDLLPVHVFEKFVAAGARNIAMFAFQRERSPLVMVKQ